MEKIFELKATTQKSYWKKAHVIECEDGTIQLKSYDTIVCEIKNGKFEKLWNGYSKTTKAHINDFRKLYNLPPINKKEWQNMECANVCKTRYMVACYGLFGERKFENYFDNYYDAQKQCDELNELHNGALYYYDVIWENV